MGNDDSRLVYTTELGRFCTGCGRAAKDCGCVKGNRGPAGDGIVRIRREIKGRGGKTVITISGLSREEDELKKWVKVLKKRCGSGGALKGVVIEIQGDHRQTVEKLLKEAGFKVKLAGG